MQFPPSNGDFTFVSSAEAEGMFTTKILQARQKLMLTVVYMWTCHVFAKIILVVLTWQHLTCPAESSQK